MHAAFASGPASSPRVRLRLSESQVQGHFRPEIERMAEGEELGSNVSPLANIAGLISVSDCEKGGPD
jgi:hypothetical protein